MTNEIERSEQINSLPFNNSSTSGCLLLSYLWVRIRPGVVHVMCEQSRRQVVCVYRIMTVSSSKAEFMFGGSSSTLRQKEDSVDRRECCILSLWKVADKVGLELLPSKSGHRNQTSSAYLLCIVIRDICLSIFC